MKGVQRIERESNFAKSLHFSRVTLVITLTAAAPEFFKKCKACWMEVSYVTHLTKIWFWIYRLLSLGWNESGSDGFRRHVKELRKTGGVGEPLLQHVFVSVIVFFAAQVSPSFSNEVFERSGVEKVSFHETFHNGKALNLQLDMHLYFQGFLPCSSARDDRRVLCVSGNRTCRLRRHWITWREAGIFLYYCIFVSFNHMGRNRFWTKSSLDKYHNLWVIQWDKC